MNIDRSLPAAHITDLLAADLQGLPAAHAAFRQLERLATQALLVATDGRDIDNTSTTETVAAPIPMTLIRLDCNTTRERLWDLHEVAGELGADHWLTPHGPALGQGSVAHGAELERSWAELLSQVPFPAATAARLRAQLQVAAQAWAAVIGQTPVARPASVPAPEACLRSEQLVVLGERLAQFAAANYLAHALGGHGKSWEPGADLTLRVGDDGQLIVRLGTASYQFPEADDRFTPAEDMTMAQAISKMDWTLGRIWPELVEWIAHDEDRTLERIGLPAGLLAATVGHATDPQGCEAAAVAWVSALEGAAGKALPVAVTARPEEPDDSRWGSATALFVSSTAPLLVHVADQLRAQAGSADPDDAPAQVRLRFCPYGRFEFDCDQVTLDLSKLALHDSLAAGVSGWGATMLHRSVQRAAAYLAG